MAAFQKTFRSKRKLPKTSRRIARRSRVSSVCPKPQGNLQVSGPQSAARAVHQATIPDPEPDGGTISRGLARTGPQRRSQRKAMQLQFLESGTAYTPQ